MLGWFVGLEGRHIPTMRFPITNHGLVLVEFIIDHGGIPTMINIIGNGLLALGIVLVIPIILVVIVVVFAAAAAIVIVSAIVCEIIIADDDCVLL